MLCCNLSLLMQPGDADALAEKMLLLVENRDLRQRMGRRGKEEALRRFHPEVVARKTMSVYHEVLREWPRRKQR